MSNPYGWHSHAERRFVCACGCGEVVVTRHPRKRFLNSKHQDRHYNRRPHVAHAAKMRSYRIRALRVGRVCRWCQATDLEVRWSATPHECEACARAATRLRCPKCKGPVSLVTERSWCVDCDRLPRGAFPVTLLDSGSDRERVVWRMGRGEHKNRVEIANRMRQVRKNQPVVLVLPTAVWLRTRR